MPNRPSGEVLHAVLDQAVTTLTGLGLTVPERRYVAGGGSAQDVPWDCSELAVVPVQIRRGDVAGTVLAASQLTRQRGGGALVRAMQLEVQLVRCYPTVKSGASGRGTPRIPDAAELGAAGDRLAADLDGIAAVLDACALTGSVGEANRVTVGPVAAVGPEGGFIAVVGGLTVSLMPDLGA